jgi:hypothetical protein
MPGQEIRGGEVTPLLSKLTSNSHPHTAPRRGRGDVNPRGPDGSGEAGAASGCVSGGGAQCRKLRGNGGQVNWLCWLERPPVCGVRGRSAPVLSPSRGTCAAKGDAPAASGHRVRAWVRLLALLCSGRSDIGKRYGNFSFIFT